MEKKEMNFVSMQWRKKKERKNMRDKRVGFSQNQRRHESKFIFTNGLIKGVSSTHVLKTLFSLFARCPNKREQNSSKELMS
jgi:hypothetical protein